jgi:hypothetical protein
MQIFLIGAVTTLNIIDMMKLGSAVLAPVV